MIVGDYMKKQTIEAFLEIVNNEPIVIVSGKEGYTEPETLLTFLRKGVKLGQIKPCTPRQEKGYTNYKFKVFNEEGNLTNYFVVKVRNKERYLHRSTINSIKDIAGISILIKKVNINRIIAGIAASATMLTLAGPTLVKGLGKLFEKEYEYDQERYYQTVSSIPSQDELKQLELRYYEDLRIRAENGDEAAREEYEIYLIEQQLKEQNSKSR